MKQYRKKTNKSIAFYFTLDEVARIDQYCEKYLSYRIVFLKTLIERFIKEERAKEQQFNGQN
ncbi:Uncharacterised protein [Campylobacter devanensis]|uniref:hypothetical protein n=1 Tax=Campylobacter TaxID=194 RepID=UPI000A34DE80|nr:MULTISPECIES: hypothetical protein [Campylobacter]SUX05161.1 Uncharacterised protein [Campylobacter lanienae]